MMAKFFAFALVVAVVASHSVVATENSEVEQQKPEVEVVVEAEASVE